MSKASEIDFYATCLVSDGKKFANTCPMDSQEYKDGNSQLQNSIPKLMIAKHGGSKLPKDLFFLKLLPSRSTSLDEINLDLHIWRPATSRILHYFFGAVLIFIQTR